jgi:hypothetical protein
MRDGGTWFSGEYNSPRKKIKIIKKGVKEKSPFIYEI